MRASPMSAPADAVFVDLLLPIAELAVPALTEPDKRDTLAKEKTG